MSIKQELLELVANLPDDCTFEEAEYRFHLLRKVRAGLEAVEQGKVISQDDLERLAGQWRAK